MTRQIRKELKQLACTWRLLKEMRRDYKAEQLEKKQMKVK